MRNCIPKKQIIYYTQIETTKGIKESPLVFKEYNINHGAIDLANMLSNIYKYKHTYFIWWHSILMYFLTLTVNNAYIIYKTYNLKRIGIKKARDTNGEVMSRKLFLLCVIRKLLHANGQPKLRDYNRYFQQYNKKFNEKVKVGQFDHIPEFKNYVTDINGHFKYNKCRYCNNSTIFMCKACSDGIDNFHMCVTCFEIHHKDKVFNKDNKNKYKKFVMKK